MFCCHFLGNYASEIWYATPRWYLQSWFQFMVLDIWSCTRRCLVRHSYILFMEKALLGVYISIHTTKNRQCLVLSIFYMHGVKGFKYSLVWAIYIYIAVILLTWYMQPLHLVTGLMPYVICSVLWEMISKEGPKCTLLYAVQLWILMFDREALMAILCQSGRIDYKELFTVFPISCTLGSIMFVVICIFFDLSSSHLVEETIHGGTQLVMAFSVSFPLITLNQCIIGS